PARRGLAGHSHRGAETSAPECREPSRVQRPTARSGTSPNQDRSPIPASIAQTDPRTNAEWTGKRAALTALEFSEFPGDLACAARRCQGGRPAGREPTPSSQRPAVVFQAQIESRREVEHLKLSDQRSCLHPFDLLPQMY